MIGKKPQAGEWWQCGKLASTRVFIVGYSPQGNLVVQHNTGQLTIPTQGLKVGMWHSLPDCDSFDWQESIPSPQLTPHNGEPLTAQDVAEIEQVESPEDWVTQDRVPARPGIDQFRWSHWIKPTFFYGVCSPESGKMHGWSDPEDGQTISLRCRRKDLPPLQATQHTCCTIDASGQYELKEREKMVTFHEIVTDNAYFVREIQWVQIPNDKVCTGRTRTELVE